MSWTLGGTPPLCSGLQSENEYNLLVKSRERALTSDHRIFRKFFVKAFRCDTVHVEVKRI